MQINGWDREFEINLFNYSYVIFSKVIKVYIGKNYIKGVRKNRQFVFDM